MVGCMGNRKSAGHLAALCGICLYYLLENIALTYTMASNAGVIISVAPFFTAILSHLFMKSEGKLRANFFIGFVVAMAAFVWACYSLLTRKISSFGYPVILTTRRTFFYGILSIVPALFLFDFEFGLERFADMTHLLNILYLGLGASALCFVTWNLAVKALGAVKTSVYIYMVPVITVVTSVLVLKKMGGQFLVYPLYYKFPEGNIPDNIRRCEEISRQSGKNCVFRIVEHTTTT